MTDTDRQAGNGNSPFQRPSARTAAAWAGIACYVVVAACGSVDKNNGAGAGAATAGSSSGANSGSSASGLASGSSAGGLARGSSASGLGSINLLEAGLIVSTSGSGDVASADGGNTQVCTDAGCTCVRIASIGHPGIYGACNRGSDGTGFFEAWLNTQSSATVAAYANAKPTITPAFLAQYDVILLQWLRDVSDAGQAQLWQFSQNEVNALADWVRAGGGVISLSGFDNDGQEIVPLNTLLSFTGLQYNMDNTLGSVCTGGRCWGGACALTGWNMASPIGAHLTDVGIKNGRSISVQSDAGYSPVVDCPCPSGNNCAVHEAIGSGHVFAFTDEWVTYTSQWLATSSCLAASCQGNTPADNFQVPQFWYNAISYASQSVKCKFTINNPAIIPR